MNICCSNSHNIYIIGGTFTIYINYISTLFIAFLLEKIFKWKPNQQMKVYSY